MIILANIYLLKSLFDAHASSFTSYGYDPILLIRFSEIFDKPKYIRDVVEQPDFPHFSILFDVDPIHEDLDWLLRFAYLPKFKSKSVQITIFIEDERFLNRIKEVFTNHGFFNVSFVSIPRLIELQIGAISGKVFKNFAYNGVDIIVTKLQFDYELSIKLSNNCSLEATLNFCFSNRDDVVCLIKTLEQSKIEQASIIKELSLELENQKRYLEIALKQKETEHILNFYHQEYEVLPLWYKRFGHVLKIILGRRKLVK